MFGPILYAIGRDTLIFYINKQFASFIVTWDETSRISLFCPTPHVGEFKILELCF